MPIFKQALIQYKEHWKIAVILGFLSMICVLAAPFVPLAGSFVLSFLLLTLQAVTWFWIDHNKWPQKNDLLPRMIIPLLVCSIVMTPTSILIGSASGLLSSPQGFMTSWPLALGIIFLGLYFYFLIARALLITLSTSLGIAQALDQAALESIKNFRKMSSLVLIFSALVLLSEVTFGMLWIITLPLLFFATSYTVKK